MKLLPSIFRRGTTAVKAAEKAVEKAAGTTAPKAEATVAKAVAAAPKTFVANPELNAMLQELQQQVAARKAAQAASAKALRQKVASPFVSTARGIADTSSSVYKFENKAFAKYGPKLRKAAHVALDAGATATGFVAKGVALGVGVPLTLAYKTLNVIGEKEIQGVAWAGRTIAKVASHTASAVAEKTGLKPYLEARKATKALEKTFKAQLANAKKAEAAAAAKAAQEARTAAAKAAQEAQEAAAKTAKEAQEKAAAQALEAKNLLIQQTKTKLESATNTRKQMEEAIPRYQADLKRLKREGAQPIKIDDKKNQIKNAERDLKAAQKAETEHSKQLAKIDPQPKAKKAAPAPQAAPAEAQKK